jgi:hypothetical protein
MILIRHGHREIDFSMFGDMLCVEIFQPGGKITRNEKLPG